MRTLVATGEKYIARLIQVNLERQGCGVLIASEGTECLMIAIKESLDLIVLDKHLPPIGGLAVYNAMHENVLSNQIKVIIIGEKSEGWPDEGTGGPYMYLHKPNDISKLFERVGV